MTVQIYEAPQGFRKSLKVFAAEHELTIGECVVEAVNEYMAKVRAAEVKEEARKAPK